MTHASIYVKKQVAPCGITCGTCDLGNGTAANTAKRTIELINGIGVKDWAPMVPGGSELDWVATEKTLEWMTKYACCAGCEKGGGSPDCAIRLCAKEKGFSMCNQCDELDSCTKFEWLGEYSEVLKGKLQGFKGKTKEQIVAEALSETS